MPYLLDANVFIESKNRHYGFDFCPAFWAWIDEEHAKGTVFSVEKVYEEIQQGADELADWTRARKSSFIKPDALVLASIQVASQWAATQGYRPDAVATFLASADLYLIAHAHAQTAMFPNVDARGALQDVQRECIPAYKFLNAVLTGGGFGGEGQKQVLLVNLQEH